ncbi:uncharacterized protein LOC122263398 isoform X1 [Penaeus japonicus]|uniref:uncharacterized protein LOC122263398 isoform X1 n=1 Tax=Penaeus japonicus TaxID=27405 RepID=UPI001C711CDF|nr:uncharacterized protein LOC122263398 isoform X1 [Penaeus japonicus]XP_042887741.1 uncharacterized protein LOC122263398 isoform X1 [Penaeus japonicus]
MVPKGVLVALLVVAAFNNQFTKAVAVSSGTALSESTGNDGTKTGECAYSNSQGTHIQIRYTESPSGEITVTGGEGYSGDGKEDVRRCRQAAEEAQKEAEKAVEEHMKAISDQDIDIRKQQEEIEKNMRDLEAQLQEHQSALQESLQRQQEEFQKQHQQIFSNLKFPFPG